MSHSPSASAAARFVTTCVTYGPSSRNQATKNEMCHSPSSFRGHQGRSKAATEQRKALAAAERAAEDGGGGYYDDDAYSDSDARYVGGERNARARRPATAAYRPRMTSDTVASRASRPLTGKYHTFWKMPR